VTQELNLLNTNEPLNASASSHSSKESDSIWSNYDRQREASTKKSKDHSTIESELSRWKNIRAIDRKTNAVDAMEGEFHNQGEAKWIVIRRPLSGHNDTPFGQPPAGLSAARGLATLRAYLAF
jgi:hypothetical protein